MTSKRRNSTRRRCGGGKFRRNGACSVEFTGENNIDHTPQDEKVRAYTGDAFDLVGERKRTNFVADPSGRMVTETFEIRIRNRKAEAAEIRVVEHMFRWTNWQITTQTLPSRKTDSRTAEFAVATQPGQEVVLNYTIQYSW